MMILTPIKLSIHEKIILKDIKFVIGMQTAEEIEIFIKGIAFFYPLLSYTKQLHIFELSLYFVVLTAIVFYFFLIYL